MTDWCHASKLRNHMHTHTQPATQTHACGNNSNVTLTIIKMNENVLQAFNSWVFSCFQILLFAFHLLSIFSHSICYCVPIACEQIRDVRNFGCMANIWYTEWVYPTHQYAPEKCANNNFHPIPFTMANFRSESVAVSFRLSFLYVVCCMCE